MICRSLLGIAAYVGCMTFAFAAPPSGAKAQGVGVAITLSTPAAIERGDAFDVVIAYDNQTGIAVPDAVLRYPIGSIEYVGASDGGTLVGFSVEWSLGTLPIGAQGSVTVQAQAPCHSSFDPQHGATLSSGVGDFASLAYPVAYDPVNDAPLALSVESTPAFSGPGLPGDRVTHTITLTNPDSIDRAGVMITLYPGAAARFTSSFDPGNGAFPNPGADFMRWHGPGLGPFESASIVVETEIQTCFLESETRLGDFPVAGGIGVEHACGDPLATAPTSTVELTPALEMAWAASSAPAPVSADYLGGTGRWQFVRAGSTHTFEHTLHNPRPDAQQAELSMFLPAEWVPIGNPPLVDPVPAGAGWNAELHRVVWSGTLQPDETITLAFRAASAPGNLCQTRFDATAFTAGCGFFQSPLDVVRVAGVPVGAFLTGVSRFGELTLFEPGAALTQPLACLPFADVEGIGITPSRELWIAGDPTIRLGLDDLATDALRFGEVIPDGTHTVLDAAHDPADGSALLSTSTDVGPRARLVRFDPATRVVTTIAETELSSALRSLVVTPGSRAAGRDHARVVEFDLGDPGSVTELPAELVQDPGSLALTQDGHYLLGRGMHSAPDQLVTIDPGTGASTVLVEDLEALTGWAHGFPLSTVGGRGEIYLGNSNVNLFRVSADGATASQLLGPGMFGAVEVAWVPPRACGDLDDDGFAAPAGCGGTEDCDDGNPNTYPGAPEANDGLDNQCPGDDGAGTVDEIRNLRLDGPHGPDPGLHWDAQPGASQYEALRIDGCANAAITETHWSDADPSPGVLFRYLVRAAAPFVGSWGTDAQGAERAVPCP